MYVKYSVLFLLLFFSEISLAQSKIETKLFKAKTAIEKNDYATAIKIYKKLIRADKENASLQLELANIYFLNNEIDEGCDCVNYASMFGNKSADTMYDSKCKEYKIKVKFLKDVDVPPKFMYDNQYYNLIENNEVNPMYLQLILDKMITYKSYFSEINWKNSVSIKVKIDASGKFVGEVIGFRNNAEQNEIRNALVDIVENKIIYKPALYKNNPVTVFEAFKLVMKNLN